MYYIWQFGVKLIICLTNLFWWDRIKSLLGFGRTDFSIGTSVCMQQKYKNICMYKIIRIYICMIMIYTYIYIYIHCLRTTHQQPTTTVSSSCSWRHFHVITGSGRVTLCHNSQQTWVTAVSIGCGQAQLCLLEIASRKDDLIRVSPPLSVMSNHKGTFWGFVFRQPPPIQTKHSQNFHEFWCSQIINLPACGYVTLKVGGFFPSFEERRKKQQPEVPRSVPGCYINRDPKISFSWNNHSAHLLGSI